MRDNPERDERRDAWLRSKGLKVVRFDTRDVMNDLDSVVQAIVVEAGR